MHGPLVSVWTGLAGRASASGLTTIFSSPAAESSRQLRGLSGERAEEVAEVARVNEQGSTAAPEVSLAHRGNPSCPCYGQFEGSN